MAQYLRYLQEVVLSIKMHYMGTEIRGAGRDVFESEPV